MKNFSLSFGALAIACLLGAAASAAQTPYASIMNSGSTNAAGYTVNVDAKGRTSVTLKGRATRKGSISHTMATKFFSDIHAAQTSGRPSGGASCMKSASFGSTMRVKAGAWSSLDLNCPVVGAFAALRDDANAILGALQVNAPVGRLITLPANEPRKMPSDTPPAPSPAPTRSP